MNPLPHDRRQEPPADLSGFTPAEIRCLADFARGRLWRFPTGYAKRNVEGEQCDRAHSVRVIERLQDKCLVRRWQIVTAGCNDRCAELTDGTAAWVARSAVSVARTWARVP